MGRSINSNKLTKEYVLNKVSQITIFSTYFNISDEVIKSCINTGELICSPIRCDHNPTCGFKYDNKGKLKFKDFAGYFWGDCFDAVALVMTNLYNKSFNVNDKHDFIKILKHITFTFKDIFYGKEKDSNIINDINKSISFIKHKKPIIEVVVRQWNELDYNYWNKIGVSFNYLNINFVYPIDQYYINRNINPQPKYYYNTNDPCYAYFLGKDRNNINNIKLYFPYRDKGITRFITNCNHLEGIYNLNKNNYDIIVITKSSKDRLSIGANILKMKFLYGEANIVDIGIINIPHENYRLRQNEFDWLISKLNTNGKLVSLMDNDRTGKIEAKWLKINYNIIPIIIPKKFNAKDFSELVTKTNVNDLYVLILNTINYINKYERKSNKLQWDKKMDNIVPF